MRIPDVFIPDKNFDTKIKEMKQGLNERLKQKALHANELSMLEDEINRLENELKECEDKITKNPDYYSVLTDPYHEEREITMKLLDLRSKYMEKKENK